jgi:hypothetical protein
MPEINDTDYRLLVDAINHLDGAIGQSNSSDDRIIMDHVKQAHHGLKIIRDAIDQREREAWEAREKLDSPNAGIDRLRQYIERKRCEPLELREPGQDEHRDAVPTNTIRFPAQ